MKSLVLIAALLGLPVASFACPEINGKFGKTVAGTQTINVGFATKIEAGKYFYNFDIDQVAPFMEADGVAKAVSGDGQTGTLTVSCKDNWVSLEAKLSTGEYFFQKATLVDADHVSIETNIPDMSDVYTRK